MKKQILILLPSRSNGNDRESNVERFIESWRKYSQGHADLCVLLDDDDEFRYTRHPDILYKVNPNMRFVPKLNKAALEFQNEYKYIANFSDDFIIKNFWEIEFINFFESNNEIGIAYGNDLLQEDKLPTAVCMSSNIINALGYFIPTTLQHMYADNFWKDLGTVSEIIKYFPNIIFEHVHPDNNKAVRDAQYDYAAAVANEDQINYREYINNGQFQSDINKVNNLKQ